MTTINLYKVTTDIRRNNAPLTYYVTGSSVSDAQYTASKVKYNGEDVDKHIESISLIYKDVITSSWGGDVEDLNPSYKPIKTEDNE